MHGNSTVPVVVEPGGDQVVAHVGLHVLGAFADRLGMGDVLSARIPFTGERFPLHDRGKVLTQAMLMFAGGGEACADIERVLLVAKRSARAARTKAAHADPSPRVLRSRCPTRSAP